MIQDANNEAAQELSLTSADIYRAASEGVVSQPDAERLIKWGYQQRFNSNIIADPKLPAVEQHKGLNLVTVAYYFGAMLMISACAWFLGDKWNQLGSSGVFITTLIYFVATISLGLWVRNKGFLVGGGLLVTVGVCLVPLITYTIEDMLGFWPANNPGKYSDFYPLIRGSWMIMELATIAVAAIALKYVRFGFLTAPMAFSFWFLSMDLAALILGDNSYEWKTRQWISVIVGIITIGIGYFLDKTLNKPVPTRSQDFAFWCYLFGMFAFWGGLTSMNSGSELGRLFYMLLNVGLIGIAIKLRRAVFLVFGALGVHIYLGHLAYTVFRNSFFFPFALALLGLSLISVTILVQRRMHKSLQTA